MYVSTNLTVKISSHEIERFEYDKCECRGKSKYNVRGHMRTHSKYRPWVCYKCDYAAKTISELKIYNGTHTGERLYRCDLCDYVETQASALKLT